MIEVEKNFDLKAGDKERLITGAVFLRKKAFTDVYYDTPDYDNTNYESVRKYERGTPCVCLPVRVRTQAGAQGAIGATRHGAVSLSKFTLTGRDFWLRTRDGRFELKVPQNAGSIGSRMTDQYRELETDAEIATELEIAVRGGLGETVKTLGYEPFARIVTTRESYQKGGFHLDFDEMDFGFSALEVELMVEKPEDITDAEKLLMDFARAHALRTYSLSNRKI